MPFGRYLPCNKAIAFHISMTTPNYALNPLMTTFNDPGKGPFEDIVERKGENAGEQHFPFSHIVFYSIKRKLHHLTHTEILLTGKG